MLRPHVRGIRFEGAELGGAARGRLAQGLVLTPSGGLATVDDADAVRQSIILLLTTIPGERVMRPDYGCPLHRLMFAPADATTAGLAIHYVRQAVSRWEPRVEIVGLDAVADAHVGRLAVTLQYRLRASGVRQGLDFRVDLQGAAA